MKNLLIILLSLLCVQAKAQGLAKSMFESDEITRNANVGVLVVDVKTGKTIDAYRADNLLPTASTMKVISTCTALELLGADYRWSTYLETDGEIVGNTLAGNLYVRGTGDPTLGSESFDGRGLMLVWATKLRELGIERIEGSVIADMSMFDNADAMNEGWTFGDMGNYYGMGVFSLNYLDNTMHINLRSGKAGEVADVISTDPQDPRVHFTSYIRCANINDDEGYAHGVAFNYERTLTGYIPAGKDVFSIRGDLPNPGLTLVEDLTAELRRLGTDVTGGPTFMLSPVVSGRRLLYEHKSAPMSKVVRETNIHSNNLFAESIFRTLALNEGHAAGVDESREIVADCWKSRGVSFDPVIQVDGCGLAPQNGVSPRTFVSLLRYMYGSDNYEVFRASLPVSGKSGTNRGLLKDTPLEGRVYAKSGTIAHLRAYCGYIELGGGRVWAFSIVVNNGNGSSTAVRREIEKYLLKLTGGQLMKN